jgi:hypothetical protein
MGQQGHRAVPTTFHYKKTETNCVQMYAPRARSTTFVEEEEET